MLDILKRIGSGDDRFQKVSEVIVSLDNFPNIKLAILLRAARIRNPDPKNALP
jgi:hypothetical protein